MNTQKYKCNIIKDTKSKQNTKPIRNNVKMCNDSSPH